MQHIFIYALEAYTDGGAVHFSDHALAEQENLFSEDLDDILIECGTSSWESYERRVRPALQMGYMYLDSGHYRDAYGEFADGASLCVKAWKAFRLDPRDGDHPFRTALDEMFVGCNIAALSDEGLQETFFESGLRYVRERLERCDRQRLDELEKYQFEPDPWKFGSDEA